MQKRVHFAPTNTVFSSSRTPSPTLSEASAPSDSSSEVSTPPPEVDYDHAHYPRSPFPHANELALHPAHYHPLQPQVQQPQVQYTPYTSPQAFFQSQEVIPKPIPEPTHMHIHYVLAFYPDTEIPIHFDLSLPSDHFTPFLQPQDLSAAATEPPLPSFTVTCPLLPWEVQVFPDEKSGRTYVTVHDVLHRLYRGFRDFVTPEEYDTLALGPVRMAVDAAYHSRCARILDPAHRTKEVQKGIRRIDFLQGMNMFKGLSGTLAGAQIWQLNVAAPTQPLLPVATAPSVI
ncbi:hypothetical protein AN958_02731 [Leucoagaricus sp. SymC.cos]|nr:hypothetical protein AN958_02731 [Leucoagaricus sp. SymC.cos]